MPLSQNNFHCNSSLPTPNPNTPSACLYPLLALLHRGPGCCCCCVISLQQIVAINYFQQPLFITSCGPTPNCPHPSLALLPWDPTSLISLGPFHMCCAESLASNPFPYPCARWGIWLDVQARSWRIGSLSFSRSMPAQPGPKMAIAIRVSTTSWK